MRLDIPTNGNPIIVDFNVTPIQPQRIRIVAFDSQFPKTIYSDRSVNIHSQRDFELRLPKTPAKLSLMIVGGSKDSLKVSQAKIKKEVACSGWMDEKTRAFVRFAFDFCEKSSYLKTGVYHSSDNQFLIKYTPTIIDKKTGRQLNTPARIGHDSGNIEVAQDKWIKYSVYMRFIILLHEYSHKYMNHQVGREINDETAADINALYIYLGMGCPPIDARLVFAYVFYGKETDQNKRRMNIIDDYIERFQRGEVIPKCK
ncbi:MAG: hypothetical protein KA974_10270 [Saprospiraceae bacterium]|nr:hypothetical protein [Saprospiraceae bacterium]